MKIYNSMKTIYNNKSSSHPASCSICKFSQDVVLAAWSSRLHILSALQGWIDPVPFPLCVEDLFNSLKLFNLKVAGRREKAVTMQMEIVHNGAHEC